MQVRNAIERFWKAHSTGDREGLKQVLAEDVAWTVVGRSCPIAKTYHGWEGFLGELLGALGTSFERGTLKMELRGIYADEQQGTGVLHLFESAVSVPTGFAMQVEIVDVIRVRDGKIVDVREIMDLAEPIQAFGFSLGGAR
jgi:ketosteroid isomerase-like protein